VAPPGSDWCGAGRGAREERGGLLKRRRKSYSPVQRNCAAGKMSRSSSESLGSGVSVCPYQPLCTARHEVWQCVRLAYMSAEHKRAVDLEKRVCLICRARGVRADGKCGQCGRDGTRELEPMFPEVLRLGPAWMLVTKAGANQDFYECMVRAEVVRRYPGPKGSQKD
jgi:hypothetical protein